MRRSVLLFAAVLLALPAFAWRLPQDVVPSNYKLRFVPDLAAEKFSGEERISITVLNPTSSVKLNAADIEFDEVLIASGGESQKATVTYDADTEIATLTVDKPLAAGPASIAIRFRGILNDKLRGFYISHSPRRKYAVTQMEPTDARRAFPSFDEPAFKATYDITIVVDDRDTAISNSKIVSDVPGPLPGKHTITFERTARMSTYLVALLVGDWECSEGGVDGIPIRVCATPENKELTKWGLTTAQAELKYFHEYYDFKYPFGKLDIIALPDFEAGAMENAGAITFREAALLIDEKSASAIQKKSVAATNAHEIAHMWFGDVVTMQWWDDIWLNEGFATWITDKPLDAWKPEWNIRVDQAAATGVSLAVDSLESTRPIRNRADTPAEINQMFDGIAYGKTAAVLRMLEAYTGEQTFRDGIRAYIRKYAYANARAEDFWSTMTEVTKQPIDKIMPSFVVQAGAPLVRATARCEGDAATLVTLAQQRMFSRRSRFLEGSPQLWTVPVTVRNLDDPAGAPHKFLLTKKEETFRVAGCSPHLFVNYDGRGFYRTAHGAGMIPEDGDLTKSLSPSERVALLNDTWALVKIGEANIASQLALIERLRNDRERAVVTAILDQLTVIGQELVSDEQKPAYRRWVTAYLRPLLSELGWSSAQESDERKQLRAGVVNVLGYIARDSETLRKSRELTEAAMKDPGSIDGTLIDVVVPLAAIQGDAALLAKMKRAMAEAKSPSDYYRYLYALIAFEDPALRSEAFTAALSPEMRTQDLPHFVGSMFEKPERRREAWVFVKTNWSELQKKFTPWGGASLVESTGGLCDATHREDVQQFFAAHPVEASDRSLKQALETIDMCIEMRTLQTRNFTAWLSQAVPSQPLNVQATEARAQ